MRWFNSQGNEPMASSLTEKKAFLTIEGHDRQYNMAIRVIDFADKWN